MLFLLCFYCFNVNEKGNILCKFVATESVIIGLMSYLGITKREEFEANTMPSIFHMNIIYDILNTYGIFSKSIYTSPGFGP